MKHIFLFFSLFLFLFACKKNEEEPVFDTNITMKGQLREQSTNAPIPGITVYAAYGEACCGGINHTFGIDSTVTDASGNYNITLRYNRDTSFITRHVAYVPGQQLRYRPLFAEANLLPTNWITYDWVGPYALPESISEVIVDGQASTTDFVLQRGAMIKPVLDPGFNLSVGDTIRLEATVPGNAHPQSGDLTSYFIMYSGYSDLQNLAVVAGKPAVITAIITRNGTKTIKTTNYQLSQGEVKEYLIGL